MGTLLEYKHACWLAAGGPLYLPPAPRVVLNPHARDRTEHAYTYMNLRRGARTDPMRQEGRFYQRTCATQVRALI